LKKKSRAQMLLPCRPPWSPHRRPPPRPRAAVVTPPPPSPATLAPAGRPNRRRLALAVGLGLPLPLAAVAARWWVLHRFTHSLSRDAFLDSDLIHVSAYETGDIVEIYVQEQSPVKKGQLLARIDPAVYEREVEVKRSQLTASESALHKAEADLAVVEQELPRKVRIAERKLDIAREDEAKAAKKLVLTREEVEKGIRAATAAVASSKAALELADEDYRRYSDLYQEGSVTQRKFQESTKGYQTAKADVDAAEARLAQVEATRNQIDIVERELQTARSTVEEAPAGLELAKLGDRLGGRGRVGRRRQRRVGRVLPQPRLQVAELRHQLLDAALQVLDACVALLAAGAGHRGHDVIVAHEGLGSCAGFSGERLRFLAAPAPGTTWTEANWTAGLAAAIDVALDNSELITQIAEVAASHLPEVEDVVEPLGQSGPGLPHRVVCLLRGGAFARLRPPAPRPRTR
jgi:multidrug resistance efflux pump